MLSPRPSRTLHRDWNPTMVQLKSSPVSCGSRCLTGVYFTDFAILRSQSVENFIALRISSVLFDIGYAADVLKSESSRRFLVMEYSFYSFIIPALSAYFPVFCCFFRSRHLPSAHPLIVFMAFKKSRAL